MKKALSLILVAAILMSVSVCAFAHTEYYAVETNTDNAENPDPVYIPLDSSNSTVEEGNVVYTGDRAEGKSYFVISKEVTDTVVYEIKGESTSVEDLTPGETYSFTSSDTEVEVGQVLEKPLEGGAVLTYTGDGKSESYTYDRGYSKVTASPSTASVSDIFAADIKMIEDMLKVAELQSKCLSGEYKADDVLFAEAVADIYIAKYPEYYSQADKQTLTAYIQSSGEYYFEQYSTMNIPDTSKYSAMLSEMKEVNAGSEEAILTYLGMTADEVKTFKGNLLYSHTPVVENSGIVHVVTPGVGFDTCEDGAIFYREGLGWSYACNYGGVDFGTATNLSLYSVESTKLGAAAFSVKAGDAVQLDKDGKAVAGLNNVKATITLPGNQVKELISFAFLDDMVNLDDPHVTAIVGGRFYTVTLDLKEWVEGKSENIPMTLEPVYNIPRTSDTHETLAELSERMNSTTDFAGAVKDGAYQNAAYTSEVIAMGNNLSIIALENNGQAELRRLVLDEDLIGKLTELKVNKILFRVGGINLSIDVGQFKGLNGVVITVDPAAKEIVIQVNGTDRTSDFVFSYTAA